MYIKFKVNHTAGISAGTVADYDNATGLRLIADGIAEESNRTEYLDYLAISREIAKTSDKSNAKTRIISLRVENGNITRFEEKKNSDADADHVISEIEAVKSEYFAKGYRQGSSEGNANASYSEGLGNGYEQGHAEGYKLGYDACMAEMANNIITDPEVTSSTSEGETEFIEPATEPATEPEDEPATEPEDACSQTENEPVISVKEQKAEPERPKRGRPAKPE